MTNTPRMIKAHTAIAEEVLSGNMPRATARKCAQCGKDACLYHHEDYDKPLDVIPMCRGCHTRLHAQRRPPLDENMITSTQFAKMNTRKIHRLLHRFGFCVVVYQRDPACEIHRPGTGERLAELEAASDETPNA